MKVLVTGATGFIGANLVRALLARGDEVHCVIRKPNALIEGLDLTLHTIPLLDHPAEIEKLAAVMRGCEIIYHLAGIFDPGPGGEERMYQLHVYGTRALLRAAEKAKVPRFLLCSSSITVAYGSRENPGDEMGHLNANTLYGRTGALRAYYNSKIQAEELVLGWLSLESVVVNPDYIIGPYDVKPTSGQMILSLAKHPIPFYPRGGKCFLGVQDCVDAHIAAAERGRVGERYLLGGHNLSYRDFLEKTAAIVGRNAPRFPLPTVGLNLLGKVGSWANRIDPKRFAGLEPHVLQAMQQERYRSAHKMISELGIEPKPIEPSIKEAYQWFQQHGYC